MIQYDFDLCRNEQCPTLVHRKNIHIYLDDAKVVKHVKTWQTNMKHSKL